MTPHLTRTETAPAFRRRRFVARHRRRSIFLVLLKPLLTALLVVGVPAAGAVWALSSPRFLLEELVIETGERIPPEWVATQLESLEGRHLLWLTLAEIESRLAGHAWVGGIAIRKELPDRLMVQVIERVPEALLHHKGALFYVDGMGVLIDEYDPDGDPDNEAMELLKLVAADLTWLDVPEALAMISELDRIAPTWSEELSQIEALRPGDYRLSSGALSFSLLVSADRLRDGVLSLQSYLPEITRRYRRITAVDVRFSGQIVVQPDREGSDS